MRRRRGAIYLWWNATSKQLYADHPGGPEVLIDSCSCVLGLVEGHQSATLECRATVSRVLSLLLRERSEAGPAADH